MPLSRGPDDLVLIHNPRCSKSRALKALLEDAGATFRVVPYLDEPLTLDALRDLRRRIGRPAIAWTRVKEADWAEAGLTREADDDAILHAIAERPRLLERPILVRGDRAIVGRPPEEALSLLA